MVLDNCSVVAWGTALPPTPILELVTKLLNNKRTKKSSWKLKYDFKINTYLIECLEDKAEENICLNNTEKKCRKRKRERELKLIREV